MKSPRPEMFMIFSYFFKEEEKPDLPFAVIEIFPKLRFQSQQLRLLYFRECTKKDRKGNDSVGMSERLR